MSIVKFQIRNCRISLSICKFHYSKWHSQELNSVWLRVRLKFKKPSANKTFIGLQALAFSLVTKKYKQSHYDRTSGLKSQIRTDLDQVSTNEDSCISTESDHFQWVLFFRLLKPYLWLLLISIATAILAAILNIKIPLQLGSLINAAAQLKDGTSSTAPLSILYDPARKLLTLYGLQSILTTVYISLLALIGERTARDLRVQLFHSLLNQELDFFDKRRTGELISRLSNDVQEFKSCFKQTISQGLRSFTQSIGCAISLYFISPKMTLITLASLPGLVIVGTLMGAVLRRMSKMAQNQVSIATAVSDEAISNIRTVKAFAMEETEEKLYKRQLDHSRYLNEVLGIGIGLFQGLSNFVLNGVVLGVIYGGTHLMNSGQLNAGQLMSFLVTSQVIQKSLAQMSLLFGQVIKGASAGARVFEYIDLEPSMKAHGTRTIPANMIKGEVRFDDVTFCYPSRPDYTVLKNFSLTLPPGKVVALCGLSGGGKSTTAALLERFYDVDSGKVSIDNIDIRELDRKWLRGKAIGFISQEPVLFHSTILENIRYGQPNASEDEVFNAAKMANAHDFILSFPRGYDTMVGERGVTLSGGQKQRIAIARALLKNPPVLILDEATSALDSQSERLVQQALEKAEAGRTVLVIAHRLSTLRNAHLIAVLAGGKVAEVGTHDSLLRRKGLFWKLTQHQSESGKSDVVDF